MKDVTQARGNQLSPNMQNTDLTEAIVLLTFARSAVAQGDFLEVRTLLDDAAARHIPAPVATLILAAIRELDAVLP